MSPTSAPACLVCGTQLAVRDTQKGDRYLVCPDGCIQVFAKSLKAKKTFKERYEKATEEPKAAPPARAAARRMGAEPAEPAEPASGSPGINELYR